MLWKLVVEMEIACDNGLRKPGVFSSYLQTGGLKQWKINKGITKKPDVVRGTRGDSKNIFSRRREDTACLYDRRWFC